jgi:membrane protease YdiL (CAAX protease family)
MKRFPVASFYVLTVALSYASYFLPIPREALPFMLVLIPALLAISLSAITGGGPAVRSLLGQLARWRVGGKWLVVAIGLGLAMRLAVGVIAQLMGHIPAVPLLPQNPMQVLVLAVVTLIAAVFEELGWRGFALSRLLQRQSPVVAGLALGIPWGIIHIILHLPGMWAEGLPWLPTVIQLVALSTIITWLFIRSGQSLLVVILFHAAQSAFGFLNEGVAQVHMLWLMTAVWSATGALALVAMAGWRRVRKPLAAAAEAAE